MAVSWRISVFQKCLAETPIFIVLFGCALFWPSCQKGKFWTPTKNKRKIWKAFYFFGIFVVFLFCLVLFSFVFFLEGFRVRWGGPKGHLAWPFSNTKKPGFLPEKAFLFTFECLALFLLSLFLPSPFFNFSFSVSLLFLSLFFPSSLSFCFLFVPCFCLFLSFSLLFAFVSWKEEHQNTQLQSFSSSIFSFFGFLSCFFFQILFSYLCFFPDLKLWFLFNINVLVSKNLSWKTPIFGQKRGCNKTFFLMSLCVAKCEKLSFFFLFFSFGIFRWCSTTL